MAGVGDGWLDERWRGDRQVTRRRGLGRFEVGDVRQVAVVVQEGPAAPGADQRDLDQGRQQTGSDASDTWAHVAMMDPTRDVPAEAVDNFSVVSRLWLM